MNPYSPTFWLYVHEFLGQNVKNWIWGVIAGYLEKRISVPWPGKRILINEQYEINEQDGIFFKK